MKKVKLTAILSMVFAVVGVALLMLMPCFDAIAAKMSGKEFALVDELSSNLKFVLTASGESRFALATNFKGLFGGDLAGNLGTLVFLIVAAILLVVFVVALVLILKKKNGKVLGLAIPTFLLGEVAGLAVAMIMAKPFLFNAEAGFTMYKEVGYAVFAILALVAVAYVLAVVTLVVAMLAKGAETAKAEEGVEEKATEEAAVAAEVAPEAVAAEEGKEEEPKPVKVVRRILVHKTGKVIRVLNEHYFDVTTNIYVEPGVVDSEAPTETEQEHYEKIIKASMEQPAPAPVAKPEPAPVVEDQPAPAPVVEEPAKAKVKVERIPFAVRLKKADKELKAAYNEIKAELLAYGFKSRISIAGDTFRLHTKTYAKIVIAGKSLKMYFALDPKNYKDSTFPIAASDKILHTDTPLIFKVKSDLSVRRAKVLVADVAAVDKLEKGEVVVKDYAKEVK